ncbi:MAG TPA: hypothetical protein VKT27_06490 [Candidatus Binataceae bacterium]|nr:hypothetical protein [Candidatus Binataceae bacterium]
MASFFIPGILADEVKAKNVPSHQKREHHGLHRSQRELISKPTSQNTQNACNTPPM